MKKTIAVLLAENYAGKTEVAQGLAVYGIQHYSVRKSSRERHKILYKKDIENVRGAFTAFCQAQKKEHGYQTFIEEIIDTFMALEDSPICVIESIRCPGEAVWLLEEITKKYPDAKVLIIEIFATYEERLGRHLRGREDQITQLTKEGFDKEEQNVNSGTKLWEENVSATAAYAHKRFENKDGMLDATVKQVHAFITKTHQSVAVPVPQ